MKQIGIFTATRWELNAVRRVCSVEQTQRVGRVPVVIGRRERCRLFLVRSGMGFARAEEVGRQILSAYPIDLAVSTGYACALTPASSIGELLIGSEVLLCRDQEKQRAGDRVIECSPEHGLIGVRAASEAQVAAVRGRLVTFPRVLWRAEQKRAMAAKTDAIGLAMEDAAVGSVAAEREIPFVAFRAVSDLRDEDLPLDFNKSLGPGGWFRAAGSCLLRPSCLIGLNRLRVQAGMASGCLTRFFETYLDLVN